MLISLTLSSSGFPSFCSTIRKTLPCSSRIIRPYPNGLGASAVKTVAAFSFLGDN